MKIIECAQGTLKWHAARAGLVTASEIDALITPLWKVRTGEGPNTYLAKKVAERWQGGPLPSFEGTFAMEQGHILEEEAKPWYSLEYNTEIQRVGFVMSDDGASGCSPDGLIGTDSGIEIKCPQAENHVKYLLDGGLPKDYETQVHFSMYVTGRSSWKFVSYRRGFPALVLTIERNEEIQKIIAETVLNFNSRLIAAIQRMEEINGGPPRRIKMYE